jgi:hypothetical protein
MGQILLGFGVVDLEASARRHCRTDASQHAPGVPQGRINVCEYLLAGLNAAKRAIVILR